MEAFNWKNIRSFNDSQNNAFEELVCQLAREEEIDNKKAFKRVGAPDGGVEAYCILENGHEYGWQAKFFNSMGGSQWRQLENSFKTAFEKHTTLVKYYICIPLDRQDPRIPNQNWFMDKWDEKVNEWTQFAQQNGRQIQFEYWGSSELIARLSLEKHAGRRYFWFNEQEFSDQWFSEQLERSIDALGNRYTPELNFELEIVKLFDGIASDNNFKDQFNKVYDALLRKTSKTIYSLRHEKLVEQKEEISKNLRKIEDEYAGIYFSEMHKVNCEKFLEASNALRENLSACEKLFDELDKEVIQNEKRKLQLGYNKTSFERHNVKELHTSIYKFQNFLNSKTVILSNLPVLILNGEAGIGKSHLLADIARKRFQKGQPSILLLGQHLVTDENPWTQILRNLLRINCNESELLGAIEAKAQSIGSRIIIIIDAINEGRGKYFWQDNIKAFVRSFEKYKWLGLVLSIRTSYEKLLVPSDLITKDIAVRITHHGFANVEYEASKLFFKNYKIEQPSIPLLHPEFQNPLFLKLFCEGLYKAGFHKIPEGYEGITTIIRFYLNSINQRLSVAKRLNYPENINLVEKAGKSFVQKRAERGSRYLPYEEAFALLESELQKFSNERRFLDELISEGIFTKNLFWDRNDSSEEAVYFAYERFDDHLTTSLLLEKHLEKTNPENSFSEGKPLFEFVKDESACYFNKGIVEALSIQLPELSGKEFYEVAPHCKSFYPVIESFVESLIWRKAETITDKVRAYINDYVIRFKGTHEQFINTLLLITSNPKHYFNANFLHKHLMRFSLPDRDAWWTTYIHDQFEEQYPVKRLIDWAWSNENKDHILDESILLIAKTIAWFLTSSNRYLRDSATKALISVLENRIAILVQLLKEFEQVNDPYVVERLYAVAYGCSLRTENKKSIKNLSEYIYKNLFAEELVYPHILLRDYAREVIEYSLHIGLDLEVDLNRIRPPYKSDWSSILPTDDEIKQYVLDYQSKDFKDYYWSQNSIIWSMQPEYTKLHHGYGDFGRYVFQRAFSNWRELDPQKLSNLAVKRIFELGYDVEKHGKFDKNINRNPNLGRTGSKGERIGKKYQWIAFYELLAKVSDNFTMYDKSTYAENKPLQYEGPWEPYVRDIDPTLLIKSTSKEQYETHSKQWWFNVSYDDWDLSNKDWIRKQDKLPNPSNLIMVKDDSETEWLVLETHPEWEESVGIGQERWDTPHKSLWYQIRSFLVPNDQIEILLRWVDKQDSWHSSLPSPVDRYEIFSREFYWSSAFNFFKKPYYSGQIWREIKDYKTGNYISRVIATTESFLWEEKYDRSKDDAISFLKPMDIIFTGMQMKFCKQEGELLNQRDELICLDPSVNHKSLSCLLIRKADFLEFLNRSDLNIFWTVLGEKQIIGGNFDRGEYPGRLEISGEYHLNNDLKITGNLNSNLI